LKELYTYRSYYNSVTVFILSFFANFVFIFLKAFQQLNVMHSKYLWVVPLSLCMATAELFVIVKVIEVGFGWIVVPVGLGGGLGAMLGMYLHQRIRDDTKI